MTGPRLDTRKAPLILRRAHSDCWLVMIITLSTTVDFSNDIGRLRISTGFSVQSVVFRNIFVF